MNTNEEHQIRVNSCALVVRNPRRAWGLALRKNFLF